MRRAAAKAGKSRFPRSIFWIVLTILLATAGVNMALILGMQAMGCSPILMTHIMVFYWIGVTALLTWLIRARTKAVYEAPMQKISEATKQVARGDFSVRLQPLHEEEKADYLDLMIGDLNDMIAELGSIETMKSDFISNVSHEIKTPIAVIQNYSSLLQAPDLSEEERKEYAGAISDASDRLSTMITNILRLSRLENQQIRRNSERFDLSGQLVECLLAFEPVWEEKQIGIDPDITDEIEIVSDRELLSIVWNNLLSNAFKFTEPGGKVSVSLKTDGDEAVVMVSDTGCGMSPETAGHIFDKFYQGDTSRSAQGNGLGLALVKRILDITGGMIEVQTAPGEGSTFTVRLKLLPKQN